MIIFEKLRYQNFLSTGNNFIEFDLNKYGSTLIVGLNGSGKSTLLDAFSFVLFGKPYRKINKSQMVNSITRKNCLVEVEFTIGDIKYLVRRGISPNLFEVFQNGQMLNQSANVKDYQQILEGQIVNCCHKSFCQMVVLGTATFQPFMTLNMSQRREVIEDLLDLQVFTSMNTDLKERVSICGQALEIKVSEKSILSKQLEVLKHHAEVLETNREQTQQEKQNKLVFLAEENHEVAEQILECQRGIGRLALTIEDEPKVQKRLRDAYDFQKVAGVKRDNAKEMLGFLEKHDTCPTCTQELDPVFKESKMESCKSVVEHYTHSVELIKEKAAEREERLKEIIDVKDQIQELKLALQALKTRKISIVRQMDDVQRDIENLSKTSEIAAEIPQIEETLQERSRECSDLEDQKRLFFHASVLLKDSGIKSKIIKQYVPIMNRLINKNLAEFEMYVNFELDENFKETIKSRGRDDFSYESFSQGERQRIDLAILFSWRQIAGMRNSINTNVLLLDEVFDSSLDSNAIEYLMNTIKTHSQTSNIIVISHKEMLDRFEHVIRMTKKRNFSVVDDAA
jgi:DNA repair exonuclease SbcCD ATPase subunit